MLENVNEVSVLVSALLLLAIGSIWYSPLVFGTYWMRSAGMSNADIEKMHATIFQTVAVGLVVNVCLLFALAKLIAFVRESNGALVTLGVYLSVIFAGALAFTVVWEKRSFVYYAIHAGYIILMLQIGIIVIGYWPW